MADIGSHLLKGGSYEYHIAILIPGCKGHWSGHLENFTVDTLQIEDGNSCKRFIQQIVERFPYVFYSHMGGLQPSRVWLGTPDSEEQVIDLSDQARFVIGLQTSESAICPVYKLSLSCARVKLIGKERFIPVYIGLDPETKVTILTNCVRLSGKATPEDRQEDHDKINSLVLYIERCILSETLQQERSELCSKELAPRKHVPPKKYLYTMIGNTRSQVAKLFQREMEENIQKHRKSMMLYQGFWDWDSEPGRQIEAQFQEKLEQSHFVIAVFQGDEDEYCLHQLLSAFKYHIDNGRGVDGHTQSYILTRLKNVDLPINFNILSSLDIYKDHMREQRWQQLTQVICDNINTLHISTDEKLHYSVHHGHNLMLLLKKGALSEPDWWSGVINFLLHFRELRIIMTNLPYQSSGSDYQSRRKMLLQYVKLLELFLNFIDVEKENGKLHPLLKMFDMNQITVPDIITNYINYYSYIIPNLSNKLARYTKDEHIMKEIDRRKLSIIFHNFP